MSGRLLSWLTAPLAWGLGRALLHLEELPRRPPDLRRLTRSPAFRALDATAAMWVGEHFRRIEERAPWLERAGEHVLDFCSCGITRRGSLLPSWPPAPWLATCRRETTVLYGFAGDLAGWLDELAGALEAVGWGTRASGEPGARRSWWLRDPYGLIYWRPAGEFTCPPTLERVWEPHQERYPSVRLHVGWIGGQDSAYGASLGPDMAWRPADVSAASPFYQPVALAGADSVSLAAAAGRRPEHQVAIRIELDYLPSAGFPGRVPKRLRPVFLPRRRLPQRLTTPIRIS